MLVVLSDRKRLGLSNAFSVSTVYETEDHVRTRLHAQAHIQVCACACMSMLVDNIPALPKALN